MTTRLICFKRRAQAEPEDLRESFDCQPGNKASGVDGISKRQYADNVEDKLVKLSAAVRRLGYKPQPVC